VLRGVIDPAQHIAPDAFQRFASVPGIDDAQVQRPPVLMASPVWSAAEQLYLCSFQSRLCLPQLFP
jgi:hypothetical protein